jgi:hypothetical protein
MINSPLALELAHFDSQERMQHAARAALAAQLRSATSSRRPSARVRLATGLRDLAVRLDPSLACEPRLAIMTNPR